MAGVVSHAGVGKAPDLWLLMCNIPRGKNDFVVKFRPIFPLILVPFLSANGSGCTEEPFKVLLMSRLGRGMSFFPPCSLKMPSSGVRGLDFLRGPASRSASSGSAPLGPCQRAALAWAPRRIPSPAQGPTQGHRGWIDHGNGGFLLPGALCLHTLVGSAHRIGGSSASP